MVGSRQMVLWNVCANIQESNASTETRMFSSTINGIPVNLQNNSTQYTTNVAFCTLFLKRELRTRFDIMRPDVSGNVASNQAQQKLYHDQHSAGRELFIGQRVMVRNLRVGDKWVPGTIMKRTGPLSYLVQVAGGQMWKRHIDQLRQMDDSLQQEQPTNKETMIRFPPANDTEPVNDKPPPAIADSTPTHRYPRRVHVPPDRLTYK